MHARGIRTKLGQVMLDLGHLSMPQFWEILKDQGDFFCGTCRERIDAPLFQGRTIMCKSCGSPAFAVTLKQAGPKPRKRRSPKKKVKGGSR